MAESSTLKLLMEKGPREGEILEYTSRCIIKIGRVVRGNTIAIKDAGISSKHMCIQFNHESCKWTLSDLGSSNGTVLNGKILKPNVPSGLKDGDCVKIGELTSIVVKIGVESTTQLERKPGRHGMFAAGAGAVEREIFGVGLEFVGDLGKVVVEGPVEKRNLRSRGKKVLDLKNVVESSSSKRILRSSKKEEKLSFIPQLKQIPETMNVDISETTDHFVPTEPKKRGRKPADIVVPIAGKKTRRVRKGQPLEQLENIHSSDQEADLNNNSESILVDSVAFDKYLVNPLEIVENSYLEENFDSNNESGQEHVAEKLLSTQEGCEIKEAVVGKSLEPGSSELHMDKGKKRQDGCESLVKNTDTGLNDIWWLDLQKMTIGDFFDYLEVQMPKEIREKAENIISHIGEKAWKCHEFRLQRKETVLGKVSLTSN